MPCMRVIAKSAPPRDHQRASAESAWSKDSQNANGHAPVAMAIGMQCIRYLSLVARFAVRTLAQEPTMKLIYCHVDNATPRRSKTTSHAQQRGHHGQTETTVLMHNRMWSAYVAMAPEYQAQGVFRTPEECIHHQIYSTHRLHRISRPWFSGTHQKNRDIRVIRDEQQIPEHGTQGK
jgi:hypothetical protein